VIRGPTGRSLPISIVGGETGSAFLPEPLPPTPGLVIDGALRDKLDDALLSEGTEPPERDGPPAHRFSLM
jgi:hypothetical protein